MFRHLIVLALAGVFAHLLSFVDSIAPIIIFSFGMLVALTGESVQFYPAHEQFTKQAHSYGLLLMSAGLAFVLNGVIFWFAPVLVLFAIIAICDELGWSPKVSWSRIAADSLALLLVVGAFARVVYYHEQGLDRLLAGLIFLLMATVLGRMLTRVSAPVRDVVV